MTSPDLPEPRVQDESPDGRWVPTRLEWGLARAEWHGGATDEPSVPLADQPHEHGRWKAGAGDFLTWDPYDPESEQA